MHIADRDEARARNGVDFQVRFEFLQGTEQTLCRAQVSVPRLMRERQQHLRIDSHVFGIDEFQFFHDLPGKNIGFQNRQLRLQSHVEIEWV